MGIISVENADHLYWLGRYTERVYTTIRVFFHIFDEMIEAPEGVYVEYCKKLGIPNIYTSNRQFVGSYLFDEENPDSVILSMKRAYDNGVVLREELSSNVLSYIQLALNTLEACSKTTAPLLELQQVLDYLLAFWGCADDYVEDEDCRNLLKCGKYVERLDLCIRLDYHKKDLEKEYRKLTGCCGRPHDFFRYRIRGTAQIDNGSGDRTPLHPIYRYPSRYTAFEPEIRAFGQEVWEECGKRGLEGAVERAVCAMNLLYERFSYVPGSTHIRTTAAQALALGTGVCQDYAHIMTAVLRYMGIPARYVNGLMIGEGYTHAWVEVYGENGWYGLDPTNNLHIDDYYIKLAHGRDYGDCPVDQGIFWGDAAQSQDIYVNVEEADPDGDGGSRGTAVR